MFLVTGRLKVFNYDETTHEYKSDKPSIFTRLIEANTFESAEKKLLEWFEGQCNDRIIVRPIDYFISEPIR